MWKVWLKKSNKRRSVFLTLFLSYILILLTPVLTGIAIFNRVEKIMIDNASHSTTALLEQARLAVDSRAKEVDQLATQIALNPKLQELLDYKDFGNPNNSRDLYKFIEFMKELSRYGTVSSYIHQFYVYFANTDTILTPTMRTDSQTYYHSIASYPNMDYATYYDTILSGYHLHSFLPSALYSTKNLNIVTYVQSLPLGERTEPKGSLIVLIDEKQIRDLINQIEWMNHGAIYIVDQNQQVILSTTDHNQLPATLPLQAMQARSTFPYTDEHGEAMLVTLTTSEQNGWTYISVVPRQIVLAKVNAVKMSAWLFVLLCVAAGAILSYLMAYRNYRPIKETVHAIMQGKKLEDTSISNEYDFIKQSIITSLAEERKLKRTISRQAPVIQMEFLSRLVRGQVAISTITEEDLAFMDVHFRKDAFCTIMVDIDNGNRFMRSDSEKEWALLRFVIGNLGAELLGEDGYSIELELNRLLFLINLESASENTSFLQSFVDRMKELLDGWYRTQVTLAVSRIHSGMQAIPECYNESSMAMDYKLLRGRYTVIYYDEVMHMKHVAYYYPPTMESQLIHYAKSGSREQLEKLLLQIYEINFQSRGLSPEMGKSLFYSLINTYLKWVHTFPMEEHPIPIETDPAKLLAGCATADEMFDTVRQLYVTLCERANEERSQHSDKLYEQIRDYVAANVTDSNLSLASIADQFKMNASYLSTFFKKQSGENLSDYILHMRIAQAKALLADKSLTLSEIAAQVGYANSVGLIRVFKKVEGITPGQYRSNLT